VHARNPLPASAGLVLLLFVTAAQAQSPKGQEKGPTENGREAQAPIRTSASAERQTLRAGALPTTGISLDGVLSEEAWAAVDAITSLTMIEPQEGGVPAGRTIFKVLANATEIVIGVLCNDPNPSGIVSNSKARDAELDDEDHITIVLDTFRDERSGYVFAVNPSGTRFDGLVTKQGSDVNSNWDAVWEARTAQDGNGWSAEIRLPIKSIGFKPGLSSWGLNVERRVERLQETSRWAGATNDYEIYQMSRAGLLTELPALDVGLGLSVRPAITTGGERSAGEPGSFTRDLSLDVTQKLGTNVVGSLTVNTDFAETEVDVRQTNLSRFEILFPEKRTFFLEGSDIFDFGIGLEDVMIPFFSRRIGLGDEGLQIPIDVGGKVNGRVGRTNMGAMVVKTRNAADLGGGEATVAAARVKENIFAESSIGMIATVGDQLGRTGSWMTGGDFTYQTSRFRGDKNLLVGGWALVNRRDDLEGEKRAYGFGVIYPNDRWNFNLTSARLGDGFDPSLGFVPRNAVHVWQGAFAFEPRPERARIRQMFHDTSVLIVNDLDRQWESYEWKVKPLDWLLESGDRFGVEFKREGDRPEEDFAVFETDESAVFIPADSHEWKRYRIEGNSAPKRIVSGEVKWESGGFYGGTLDSIEATVVLRQSLFKVELGAERNMASSETWTTLTPPSGRRSRATEGGRFTQNLYNTRLEVKFSPDLQVSSFLQYDNESASFGTNTRVRWTFHPSGDLFVVYNHNLQRSVNDLNRRIFEFDSNALVVKLQYAWRP
jgi:uncharacterized protein DUF5916